MIVTKKEFCKYAEREFANSDNTMIDTVLNTCEEFSVDPDLVEPLINRSLREKMKIEYIKLNYIKSDTVSLFK